MSKVIIGSFEDFAAYVGKDIGVSDYLVVTQDQINRFADATLDHQWIHTDPRRASRESPFGRTIAHGYLTLGLTPHLWEQITEIRNILMQVNYSIENLRFNQPVLVDSPVRLRVSLESLANLRGVAKAVLHVVMEIKDNPKPAFTASLVFLYHFKTG